jgi:hypothetical protein
MIADDVWNEWLQEVVGVLNTHEKLIKNSVGFLGLYPYYQPSNFYITNS